MKYDCISVAEVARALGISRPTIYKAVMSGVIPSMKVAGRIVIPVEVLDRMFRRCVGPSDQTPTGG